MDNKEPKKHKRQNIKRLRFLLEKEFLQIFRNGFMPKMLVAFPLFVMCIMPWVLTMDVKNIKVDVVDNDHSTLSQQLVQHIVASNYFIFHKQQNTYTEAMKSIEKSETDIIITIPQHFERDKMNGLMPQVFIAANTVNGTKGMMGSSYLSNIVTRQLYPEIDVIESNISILYLYNKHLNYKLYMIPSLIAMLLMMLCGFLPTLNIVAEKEAGTIEAINVTPVGKWTFILAKLIPYWLIAILVVTICFIIAWLLYGITSVGSLPLVYLLCILLAFVFSGLGLVISNYNETMQQAAFAMWFIIMIMIMMSGLFTPSRSMPDWAYATTYLNPMHYFIGAIRTIFVRGGNFQSIASQVWSLLAFAIAMDTWAVVSYKKNSK